MLQCDGLYTRLYAYIRDRDYCVPPYMYLLLWYITYVQEAPEVGKYASHQNHYKNSRCRIEELDIGGATHGNGSTAGIHI